MIIAEPSCIKSDYCWDAVLSHSHIKKKIYRRKAVALE